MAEYIDRDAFLHWVKEFRPDDKEIASAIRNAPAADVAPVVHGRWDVKIDALGREYTVCSVCNSNFRIKQDSGRLLRVDLRGFCYCPNCGAKMDGGAKNDL